MNFRSFASGFAVAAIIAIAGGLWLAKRLGDQPIRWMPKTYYDDGDIRDMPSPKAPSLAKT